MTKQKRLETLKLAPPSEETVDMCTVPSCFSGREMQVLNLVMDGENTKGIADRLCLSEDTVETHRRSIIKRCGAKNMSHAVAVAFRKGWVK